MVHGPALAHSLLITPSGGAPNKEAKKNPSPKAPSQMGYG